VGVGFNAWSLANIVAATEDKDLFPDIASRAKASKQRQIAIKLFDVFRKAQKEQKIADGDLAKLAGADLTGLKPVLDYYDALPKK
jgi:ssDNA-binding replication factor A large subunit